MELLHDIGDTLIGILFFVIFFTTMISLAFLKCTGKTEYEKLYELSRRLGCSEYQIFVVSGCSWNISEYAMEEDFTCYLKSSLIPFYVRDYIRRRLPSF
jgi:hypothetical protein